MSTKNDYVAKQHNPLLLAIFGFVGFLLVAVMVHQLVIHAHAAAAAVENQPAPQYSYQQPTMTPTNY